MGRIKKKDKEDCFKKLEDSKELLREVKVENNFDIAKIFGAIERVESESSDGVNVHLPVNTLEVIKKKLSETKVEVNPDTGEEILVPVIKEEEKVKAIFSMLADKGLNVLDFIERELAQNGFDSKILFALNESFDRATGVLKDICDIQYRKAELDIKRSKLEIERNKLELRKREVDIRERKELGSDNAKEVLATASPAEMLQMLNGQGTITNLEENKEEDNDENMS